PGWTAQRSRATADAQVVGDRQKVRCVCLNDRSARMRDRYRLDRTRVTRPSYGHRRLYLGEHCNEELLIFHTAVRREPGPTVQHCCEKNYSTTNPSALALARTRA